MKNYKPDKNIIKDSLPFVKKAVDESEIKLTEKELFNLTKEILSEYGAHIDSINVSEVYSYSKNYITLCSFDKVSANRKKFFTRQRIVYLAVIAVSIVYLIIGNMIASRNVITPDGVNTIMPFKATVTKIISVDETEYNLGADGEPLTATEISFYAKIKSGDSKGQTVKCLQQIDPFYALKTKEVNLDDNILVYYDSSNETEYNWHFYEFLRTDSLLILGVIFIVALLIFGKMSGINTLISLGFTCLAVFVVFIPSVLSGQNIYASSIITCVYIIAMTLPIISGINKKTISAIIGCCSGVFVSGVLTVIMSKILGLTGMVDDQSMYLMYISDSITIDLKAIIFSGIIIGAVGAIMDVAMSMSSSLYELANTTECPTFKALMKSGLTIGRDIMGTMANTLILAYIGSSLSITLLLVAYNKSLLGILNREMLVVEVLQSLVGSLGILFTIPLSSIVGSLLFTSKKKSKKVSATND